jgi:hypothetical protein
MAVLQEQVAGGVAGRINLRYLAVAVLALAIGVGATVGVNSLRGSDDPSRTQIASVRWDDYVEMSQNRWIAQVNATRGEDLVAFYRNSFLARAGEIQAQRAEALVGHLANQHWAETSAARAQRTQDMVDFRYGSGS